MSEEIIIWPSNRIKYAYLEDNYAKPEVGHLGRSCMRIKEMQRSLNFLLEKWLLDLVAIGTVADCHELLGENRILVKYGLKVLQKTCWLGLKALIASSNLDFTTRSPDTYSLGFVLAPRLNAAGRLEHANIALELLLETDNLKAKEKAQRFQLQVSE